MSLRKGSEEVPGGLEGRFHTMAEPTDDALVQPPSYEDAVGLVAPDAEQETNVDEAATDAEEMRGLLSGLMGRGASTLASQLGPGATRGLTVDLPCPLASGEDTDGDTDMEDNHQKMRRRLKKNVESDPSSPEHDELEMKPLEPVSDQVPLRNGSDLESGEDSDPGDAEPDVVSANNQPTNDVALNRGSSPTGPEDVTVTVPQPRPDYGYLFQDQNTVERCEEPEPDWTVYTGRCAWLVNKWRSMSDTKFILVVLAVVLLIGLILLVTLLPASFVYVEYYEYAMSRNKLTGVVDTSSVYDFGCHLLAPQDELVRFPSTYSHVGGDVEVMTSESLWINVYVTMQYRLKREELGQLYRRYDFTYKDVINSLIGSSIKNLAIDLSLDQFRLNRSMVETAFRTRLERVLSGDCADSDQCGGDRCRPLGQCYPGHHVELKHFQLGRVWVPDTVTERYMRRVLLQVHAEREHYIQEHALEVKVTERNVKALHNQAKEVREEAEAKKLFISTSSEAKANLAKEKAFQQATAKLFSRLNITTEDNKLSFMMVKAFETMKYDVYSYGTKFHSVRSP